MSGPLGINLELALEKIAIRVIRLRLLVRGRVRGWRIKSRLKVQGALIELLYIRDC